MGQKSRWCSSGQFCFLWLCLESFTLHYSAGSSAMLAGPRGFMVRSTFMWLLSVRAPQFFHDCWTSYMEVSFQASKSLKKETEKRIISHICVHIYYVENLHRFIQTYIYTYIIHVSHVPIYIHNCIYLVIFEVLYTSLFTIYTHTYGTAIFKNVKLASISYLETLNILLV